jgi:hypothetical protein
MLEQLCNTLAAKIVDYRSGEISVPDTVHVERWINQFDEPNWIPILNEMIHLIDKVYLSKTRVTNILSNNIQNPNINGRQRVDRRFRFRGRKNQR